MSGLQKWPQGAVLAGALILGLCPILTCDTQKQEVVMQIIVPFQSASEKALQNTHLTMKQTIKHGREVIYRHLRASFTINSWLNFTETESPSEILTLFCTEVFARNVNAILYLNHGAESFASNDYILKLADHLGYPVISWDPHYPGALQSMEDSRVLQIAPTIYHQCQAMIRILDRYNWTEFSIVTSKISSNIDFISCMQDLVKQTSTTQGYLTIAKYTMLSAIIVDIDDSDSWEAKERIIKKSLTMIKRTVSRVILLHAGSGEAKDILDGADEMGITGAEYMWILTSFSVGSVSRFAPSSYPLGTLGLMYNESIDAIQSAVRTAIQIWALGLEKIAQEPELVKSLRMYPSVSCNGSHHQQYWTDGKVLYEKMRSSKLVQPPVSFTFNGIIEHVELKIVNVRPFHYRGRKRQRWETVGSLVPTKNIAGLIDLSMEMDEVVWPGGSPFPPRGRPEKKFFRVATLKEPPYIIYIPPDQETGKCSPHAVPCKVMPDRKYGNVTVVNGTVSYCCTGLCVDLLRILAERLDFDYELYEVEDRNWGIENDKNKEWNGLIQEMIKKKGDMVVTSLKINHQRNSAIDFSVPFMETGITIIVSIRKGAISATAFLEHKFSLFRSFWLIWAMLFGASVTTDNLRGMSSRFLANVWALFALVFLASYTANLAAFMITIDEYYDLTGIQDWRLRNPTSVSPHFKFATVPNGSTEENLKKNYPRMHSYMMRFNKSDVESGILSLKQEKIDAFIYDATVLEYLAGGDKDCDLITVGKWYAMTGYGVGFPKGSKYVDQVSTILLDLQHNGELERLQKFWLAGACHAQKDKKEHSSHNIGILNFTSAFILLAGGVMLGALLLTLEHFYFKFGRKCLKKYDKCGCCALISLSLGKSLTFEQSVMEAIDYHKRHKCKDPLCETQLWKARHELDLALLKIERLRTELSSVDRPADTTTPEVEDRKFTEPNGMTSQLSGNRNGINTEGHYEIVDRAVRATDGNTSVKSLDTELSEIEKRRLQFRRSPSYTNAVSIDSDVCKVLDVNRPPSYDLVSRDYSPKRCPSYSQAVEEGPVLDVKSRSPKPNSRTRYFDGKYYVGVPGDQDESAL